MPRQNKKIVVGVTGGFGTGKTTVSGIFKKLGAYVVDADKIAHAQIMPQGKVFNKIIQTFGQGILDKNKRVDRKKLAKIAFSKNDELDKLNRLVHPALIAEIKRRLAQSRKRIVVLDAPLLIEAGLKEIADKLVVVTCSSRTQAQRLKKKHMFSDEEIAKRTSSQMSILDKVRLADFVIDNNGTRRKTEKQAKEVWKKLSRLAGG